jgi:hypothetical protein
MEFTTNAKEKKWTNGNEENKKDVCVDGPQHN